MEYCTAKRPGMSLRGNSACYSRLYQKLVNHLRSLGAREDQPYFSLLSFAGCKPCGRLRHAAACHNTTSFRGDPRVGSFEVWLRWEPQGSGATHSILLFSKLDKCCWPDTNKLVDDIHAALPWLRATPAHLYDTLMNQFSDFQRLSEEKMKDMRHKIEWLEAERARLLKAQREHVGELTRADATLSQMASSYEATLVENSRLKQALQEYEAEKTQLKRLDASIQERSDAMTRAQLQVAEKDAQISELGKELQESRAAHARIAEEAQGMEARVEVVQAVADRACCEAAASAGRRRAEMAAALVQVLESSRAASARNSLLENTIQGLESQVSTQAAQVAAHVKEAGEVDALVAGAVQRMEAQVELLEQQTGRAHEAAAAASAHIQRLTQHFEGRIELSRQRMIDNGVAGALKRMFCTLASQALSAWQRSVCVAKSERAVRERTERAMRGVVARMRSSAQVFVLQAWSQFVVRSREEGDKDALLKRIQERDRDVERLADGLGVKEAEIGMLKRRLGQAQGYAEEMKKQVSSLTAEVEMAKQECENGDLRMLLLEKEREDEAGVLEQALEAASKLLEDMHRLEERIDSGNYRMEKKIQDFKMIEEERNALRLENSELKEAEMKRTPSSLCEQKRLAEEGVRKQNKNYRRFRYAAGGGFEGIYGSQQDFHEGLHQYNGRPMVYGARKLEAEMRREFLECQDDAIRVIKTTNYGGLETTLTLEWEFVVNPLPDRIYPGQFGHTRIDPATGTAFPGRKPRKIEDFVQEDICRRAKLTRPEVIGLRLYTGASSQLIC